MYFFKIYVIVLNVILYPIWFHLDICKRDRRTKWFALNHQSKFDLLLIHINKGQQY